MMFGKLLNSQRIFKRPAKALIRLRVYAGWSDIPHLVVAHTTLLKISCRGSNVYYEDATCYVFVSNIPFIKQCVKLCETNTTMNIFGKDEQFNLSLSLNMSVNFLRIRHGFL